MVSGSAEKPEVYDSAILEAPPLPEDRLEIRSSRLQSFFAFGICMLFVIGGGAILVETPPTVLFLGPGVLLFGQLATFHFREGIQGRPRLVLDQHGLDDRQLGTGRIAWEDVAAVRLNGDYPHLLLEVRDPGKYARRQPLLLRFLGWMNSWFGYPRFIVNLLGLGVDTAQVVRTVEEIRIRHLTGGPALALPGEQLTKKAGDSSAAEEPARISELMDD